MTHEQLVQQAAAAMSGNGRLRELAVLRALPDEMVRDIIAYHAEPVIVA